MIAGGLLTQYVDWRWCLYINIPMACIALLGAPLIMADQPISGLHKVDFLGVVLSTASVVALVYAFAEVDPNGWGSPRVLLLLGVGVVLLAAFVTTQAKLAHPLLPLRIVTHRARGAAFVSVFLMFVAMFGFYLFVSYYTQTVLGYSAVRAGMTLLVNAVCTIIGSMVIAARLYGRVRPNVLIVASMLSAAIGMLILTQLSADSTNVFVTFLLPAQILTGLGFGCLLAAATNQVTAQSAPEDAGVASGAYNAVQQLGAALGTALLNSIATGVTAAYVAAHGTARATVNTGTVHGYSVALWVAFGVLVVGAGTVVAMDRPRSRALAMSS